ncbi:MAG: hypothetical protein KAI72_01580 [Candidatus Pacebacteria bacterium]|nr:hypothetical protein [Candidatus Paceibacterota bacterium]
MKKLLWNSMLDADLNTKYWYYLNSSYNTKNFWVKVFLLIVAAGQLLSLLFTQKQFFWTLLSVLTASIALFHLFVDWGKSIEKCYMLQKEWTYIKDKYDILWSKFRDKKINDDELEQQYTQLKAKENDISYMESGLPQKKELIRKCHQEVLSTRGLSN